MKRSDLKLHIAKDRSRVRLKRRISGYVSERIHYQTKQSHTAVLQAAPLLSVLDPKTAMQAKQEAQADGVITPAPTDEKGQQGT